MYFCFCLPSSSRDLCLHDFYRYQFDHLSRYLSLYQSRRYHFVRHFKSFDNLCNSVGLVSQNDDEDDSALQGTAVKDLLGRYLDLIVGVSIIFIWLVKLIKKSCSSLSFSYEKLKGTSPNLLSQSRTVSALLEVPNKVLTCSAIATRD